MVQLGGLLQVPRFQLTPCLTADRHTSTATHANVHAHAQSVHTYTCVHGVFEGLFHFVRAHCIVTYNGVRFIVTENFVQNLTEYNMYTVVTNSTAILIHGTSKTSV